MNVISKTWMQIVARFMALPQSGRLAVGGLAVISLLAISLLFRGNMGGPNHLLLSGRSFSRDELTRIESAFAKKNLSNYRVDEGQVRVPHAQQAQYLAALADADALPSNIEDELLKTDQEVSPWLTSQQLGESQRKSTQAYLSRIIREMDGISKAYVLLDSKKPQGLKRESQTTASVSVESDNGRPLDKHRIPQIRHLVASAVAGLDPTHVTVVDLNGPNFSAAGSGTGVEGHYLERMTAFQEYYRQAVLDVLAYIPEATAVVNVELDQSPHDSRGSPLAPPPRPGEPGADNAVFRPDFSAHSESRGYTPDRITVSISIPRTWYEQLWQQRNPSEQGQAVRKPSNLEVSMLAQDENAKLRAAVAQVIPGCTDPTTAAQRISVNWFERLTPVSDVRPAPGALAWLAPYSGAIGIVSMLVAGVLILGPMFRSKPKDEPGPAGPRLGVIGAETTAAVRAELAQMVESDPAAAARILRDWLGKAG